MATGLVPRCALAFSSAGLAIAVSLTLAHLSNTPLPCGGGSGCEDVARDPSSQLFGIPVAAFGVLGYLVLVVCALFASAGVHDARARIASSSGLVTSLVGVLVSLWLTYHSITSIHATCVWCLSSLAMMAGVTICFGLMTTGPKGEPASVSASNLAPWIAVPILAVAAIAFFGNKTIVYDLDLTRVSYDEVVDTSHPLGDPKARITIVEFGDLMCPACRQMHPLLRKLQSKFPDKVSLLYHDFPMSNEPGHELSTYAAWLSDTLSPTDFWKFVDAVYAAPTKPDRAGLNKIYMTLPSHKDVLEIIGRSPVDQEVEEAKAWGVKMTPTYILFIDKKPDAWATSLNLGKVLSQPEFRAIIEPAPHT